MNFNFLKTIRLAFFILISTNLSAQEICTNSINVLESELYDIYGDGINDDAAGIRAAFESGNDLYFPPGTYLLKTVKEEAGLKNRFLTLDHTNNGSCIEFHTDAHLIVDPTFISITEDNPNGNNPMNVIWIEDKENNIEDIRIEGVNINGNCVDPVNTEPNCRYTPLENGDVAIQDPFEQKGRIGGIFIYSITDNTTITGIQLNSPTITQCTGSAITSTGEDVTIRNATTSYNNVQGIGARDEKIGNGPISLNIYTHDSHYDGQAVDWSGKKLPPTYECIAGYSGIGEATNLTSFHSRYGTKIAGRWTLDIQDVTIDDSRGNGFWTNGLCPDIELKLKGLEVNNCVGTALKFQTGGNFDLEDIKINSCPYGFQSQNDANLLINDMEVTNKTANSGFNVQIIGHDNEISNMTIESDITEFSYAFYLVGSGTFEQCTIKANNHLAALVLNYENIPSETCWKNSLFECSGAAYTADGIDQVHYFENCTFDNGPARDIRCNFSTNSCAEKTFYVHNTVIGNAAEVDPIDIADILTIVENGNILTISNPQNVTYTLVHVNGDVFLETDESSQTINLPIGDFLIYLEDLNCPIYTISIDHDCTSDYGFAGIVDENNIELVEVFNNCDSQFDFFWEDGVLGPARVNLPLGEICVNIYPRLTDECVQCPSQLCFVIEGNNCEEFFTVTSEIQHSTCLDENGEINISIDENTYCDPYTYEWSNGSTEKELTGVATGKYCVTITSQTCIDGDDGNCQAVECYQVSGKNEDCESGYCIQSICKSETELLDGYIELYFSCDIDEFNWELNGNPYDNNSLILYSNIPGEYCLNYTANDCTSQICLDLDLVEIEKGEYCPLVCTKPVSRNSSSHNFLIHPNPSNGELNFSNYENIEKIEIHNIEGVKLPLVKTLSNGKVNVSNLENGLYFIVIYTKQGEISTQKFIKI